MRDFLGGRGRAVPVDSVPVLRTSARVMSPRGVARRCSTVREQSIGSAARPCAARSYLRLAELELPAGEHDEAARQPLRPPP